ncbi:MAG: hypothetical protein WC069_07335 [Candidatus Shapirobacteria bacterium]
MFSAEFDRQSSAADWDETVQLLAEDDGLPMWTTVPGDLILTLTVIPEGICVSSDYGSVSTSTPGAVITAVSTDLSGRVAADINGMMLIFIDDSDMVALAPDRYGIDKRYLVFIKAQFGVYTKQGLVGILPVYRGA